MTKTQIAIKTMSGLYSIEYPWVWQHTTFDGRPCRKRYKPTVNKDGYPCISVRRRKLGICMKATIHQIVAHQKYGDNMFGKGCLCRHLDSDKSNFRPDNIVLGTKLDNYNDNTPAVKALIISSVRKAGLSRRRFSMGEAAEIRELHKKGFSIGQIAKEKECAKNTIRYLILNFTYGS